MQLRMKYKKIIMNFLAVILIGSNTIIYANEPRQLVSQTGLTQDEPVQEEPTTQSLAELYHKAGLDSPEVIINTLATLGISKEELQECVGQGKKIYDILQDKQIAMAKFKKALTKEYRSRIKKATKDKVITKNEAKILTDLLNERMGKWEV